MEIISQVVFFLLPLAHDLLALLVGVGIIQAGGKGLLYP